MSDLRAKQVKFDNSGTGLAATQAQDAVVEVNARIDGVAQGELELTLDSVTAVLEVGDTATEIAFTATYGDRTPATDLTLLELVTPAGVSLGGETLPVAYGAAAAFSYVADLGGGDTFKVTTLNGTKLFALNATDIYAATASAMHAVVWSPAVIWGQSDVPVDYLAATLETLIGTLRGQNFALQTAKEGSYAASPSATNRIYFAVPSSYGAAVLSVSGIEGGFAQVGAAVPVTNSFGETFTYDLYESLQVDLGVTTFEVS